MRRSAVITDAQGSTSAEMSRRQKRYVITMLFRLACFVAMIFVPGVWRWVLGAGAVFLPYLAVIFANQVDTRGRGGRQAEPSEEQAEPTHPELESTTVIEPDGPGTRTDRQEHDDAA